MKPPQQHTAAVQHMLRLPVVYAFPIGDQDVAKLGVTPADGILYGVAIAEDGYHLAAVRADSTAALRHDLGADGLSKAKHSDYDEYYPAGWRIEWTETGIIPQALQRVIDSGRRFQYPDATPST